MTSRFKVRPGALINAASNKPRIVTAKWVLDYQGVPFELTIQPGEVAVYDEEAAILHIRNEETGHSRTFTPTVEVTIDHNPAHPHFEVEFCDPDDPRRFMPSIVIGSYVSFYSDNGREGFTFSNRAMFETFCDFMASPIYNPFTTPIPQVTSGICADVKSRSLYYRAFLPENKNDDPDPYLGREHEYPIDEQYPWFVSFTIELDRPVIVWDRHAREDRQLGSGQYHARVSRWDRKTGEPTRIIVEGTSDAGDWMQEGHVDWQVLEMELRLAHARWGRITERQPFDPTHYKPLNYGSPISEKTTLITTNKSVPKPTEELQAPSPKSNSFLKKLFGR